MRGEFFAATVLVCLVCLCLEFCPASATTTSPTQATPTPVPTVEDTCGAHNGSCDKCVSFPGAKCFYCETTKICALYPAKEVFPTKYCALSEARWGVCFLNFEALIIAMGVIGGALLLGITICLYCCCCRSGSNRAKRNREEREYVLKRFDHHGSIIGGQKKADRKAKNDEIRRKYGLMPDDEGSYHRFEETA